MSERLSGVTSSRPGEVLAAGVAGPRRILVVDDNPSIHDDFRKLLCPAPTSVSLSELEVALFGASDGPASSSARARSGSFQVDVASQGQEGLEMVVRARRSGRPYALAFVDMRMPPGWDGVETIARMLEKDPDLEVVICSAYSDYSWHEVIRRVNRPGLRLLRKPFESKDVLELAWSLTTRWIRRRSGQKDA
jgi:CheY-like chemotaxis protein